MLLFGHPGITLGAAVLFHGIWDRARPRPDADAMAPAPGPLPARHRVAARVTALGRRIDLRLLLIASMLPDIIDKPVGMLLLRDTFSSGRIFSHTLLFVVPITLGGLYLYLKHRHTWLLVLGLGSTMHLVLDEMWLSPHTLLWPLYGFSFAEVEVAQWVPNMLLALFTDPLTGISELVGAAILVWLTWWLVRRRKLLAFIRHGQV